MRARVQVWIGTGVEAVWTVARAWFEAAARDALRARLPWAVLLPTRAHAHALKIRALESGINLGAVHLHTPGEARDVLRGGLRDAPTLAPREHLHLLLAALIEEQSSPIREPARLLRALDQLELGGHALRELGFPPAEQLARSLEDALHAAGWTTPARLDRTLAANAVAPQYDRLLIAGFDAAHWEHLHLLLAAARSAARADIVLATPRSKAEALDQAWIGTFEEAFGAAELIAHDAAPRPFAPLAQRMENPTAPLLDAARPRFLVGRTLRDQAAAAVAQALAFACGAESPRIGIVVPGPGPLAREIAAGLQSRGVPFFDAFGRRPPPDPTARRWLRWTEFQRAPGLTTLMSLLAEQESSTVRTSLLDELDRSFTELLADDLLVLQAHLSALERPSARDAARVLARYAALPARASVRDFVKLTAGAWRELGWDRLYGVLHVRQREIAPLAERVINLSAWLDWLDAVAPHAAPIRAPDAANPLARIHLLGYAQAEGQPWTHLVLAGLNEGDWPPPAETAGLLSEERIAELNRRTLAQGKQGEGHVIVKSPHALILGGIERREVLRRQFYNLVEAPTQGLAACCSLEREDGSGRLAPAGDFLSHLFFSATDTPLTDQTMRDQCARTHAWLARIAIPHAVEPPPQPTRVEDVAAAWSARRALAPFGPFECAFTNAPPTAITLSCRTWENAVRDPYAVWFEHFLRVRPAPDWKRDDPWPKTQGIWVHRWLSSALCEARSRFERRRVGEDLVAHVQSAVERTRAALGAHFAAGGRPEPQRWRAHLAQAEWMARSFAQRLAEVEEWPIAVVEWKLPRDLGIPLREGRLRTYGYIDALFAHAPPTRAAPEHAWIVDFKTGNEKALTQRKYPKSLRRGHGIQISLYALAVAELGAQSVSISLLTANEPAVPQVGLDTLRAEESFWQGLLRMQETGVFGMRGAVRAEYGPSLIVPLATLPIDPARLEEKWALTHPNLAEPEEGTGE